MRKGMVGFLVVLWCASILASGCAKKELVKGEEVAPPAATVKPEAAPPAKPEVKEQAMQEKPIMEAALKEEMPKEAAKAVAAEELQKVYFDFDSYLLTQPARDALYKNAEWLLKKPSVKAQVEGHCDERGSDEYNLALGEKRAKAASDYLVTLGVPAEQLSIISYGKERPADRGHDETAWAKNRRAEFVILSK